MKDRVKKVGLELVSALRKNKFFPISFVIIILLISVSWYISYAYFKDTSTRSLITGKIGDVSKPDYNILYMIENRGPSGAGNETYYASYKVPVKDYTYVAAKSSCTNGATFIKNDDDTFDITSNGPTKCYFYFDAININTSEDVGLVIKKERKKINGTGSGFYEDVTDVSISALIKSGYEYNSSKSTCSAGTTIEYDFINKKIKTNSNSFGAACTVYFDSATQATVGFFVLNGTMSNYFPKVNFGSSLTTSFTAGGGYSATHAIMNCEDGITGTITGTSINLTEVNNSGVCVIGIPEDFDYIGANSSYLILESGYYKLQVWGAQGGNAGGKGGYSEGEVYLNKGDNLVIHVGGAGSVSTSGCGGAGYNGGGCAYTTGGGGGGATDIRIGDVSLNSRVIVAGGGGGKGRDTCAPGAVGGGISGGGYYNSGSCGYQGGGGTINEGGVAGTNNYTPGIAGTFGLGASSADGTYDGGGGGGGWFGGGSGASGSYTSGGGGGSGFYFSSGIILLDPDLTSLSTKYYIKNGMTFSGDVSFPSKTGGLEVGHADDGYARITMVRK